MSTLINMLGESKIIVRQCVTKVINKLMQTLTPDPVLKKLGSSVRHRSWRVREELTNIIILALSTFPAAQIDVAGLFKQLATLMTDKKSRVQYVAMEAVAVLQQVVGELELDRMLQATTLPERTAKMLATRLENTARLPAVNDGVVEHLQRLNSTASSTISAMSASHGRSSAFPWSTSSTLRRRDSNTSLASTATHQSEVSMVAQPIQREAQSTGSYADLYKAKLESRSSIKRHR